jgi:hypothetical protein
MNSTIENPKEMLTHSEKLHALTSSGVSSFFMVLPG